MGHDTSLWSEIAAATASMISALASIPVFTVSQPMEREVRANLVYCAFTRIGDAKVPDAKTLARLGQPIGPEVIDELHQRIVQLAQVTRGRKLRVGQHHSSNFGPTRVRCPPSLCVKSRFLPLAITDEGNRAPKCRQHFGNFYRLQAADRICAHHRRICLPLSSRPLLPSAYDS